MNSTHIRLVRLKGGFSLAETGKAAGLSPQHVSRIELLDIPATVGHEAQLRMALLRLINARIRMLLQLKRYCKAHAGHLLETTEECEHE